MGLSTGKLKCPNTLARANRTIAIARGGHCGKMVKLFYFLISDQVVVSLPEGETAVIPNAVQPSKNTTEEFNSETFTPFDAERRINETISFRGPAHKHHARLIFVLIFLMRI